MDQRLCLPVWLACISSFHHLHSHCWGVLVSSFTTVDRLWLPQFCISLLCHCRRSWSSSVRLVVWMSYLPSCSHCHAELMSWDKFKCHFSRLPLDPPPPPPEETPKLLPQPPVLSPIFGLATTPSSHRFLFTSGLPPTPGHHQLLLTINLFSPLWVNPLKRREPDQELIQGRHRRRTSRHRQDNLRSSVSTRSRFVQNLFSSQPSTRLLEERSR